ncbi:hypothetical protein [Neisseria wadsworthii]|uniref:hypothetical protein n=1 Tax=Neisseria wadsworthii TaxID=607711 RepID=UPI000D31883E|nr:hypothetical protein [Neisseria wadsworthii]
MSTIKIALAALLVIWFLASIVWGSIWMNLVTSSQEDKEEFLNEHVRSPPDRIGISMLRFPVLHLIIWLINVVGLCWVATGWWQSL